MTTTIDKKLTWSYRETAAILGMDKDHGARLVGTLVTAHGLEPKRGDHPKAKGLDRADIDYLARLLRKTIAWPD